MTTADDWRRTAQEFTTCVEGVGDQDWERPAPPEGWVARDVVRHLVEWVPGLFFGSAGLPVPPVPSVDDDPVAAWRALDEAVQALLEDPARSALPTSSPAGSMSVEQLVAMTGVPDVFLHRWDLARATGQDERLDPDRVHALLVGMLPWDQALRASGQYGPRVEVPDDADEQTQLLAFVGRRP